jgi:hypothetical protein
VHWKGSFLRTLHILSRVWREQDLESWIHLTSIAWGLEDKVQKDTSLSKSELNKGKLKTSSLVQCYNSLVTPDLCHVRPCHAMSCSQPAIPRYLLLGAGGTHGAESKVSTKEYRWSGATDGFHICHRSVSQSQNLTKKRHVTNIPPTHFWAREASSCIAMPLPAFPFTSFTVSWCPSHPFFPFFDRKLPGELGHGSFSPRTWSAAPAGTAWDRCTLASSPGWKLDSTRHFQARPGVWHQLPPRVWPQLPKKINKAAKQKTQWIVDPRMKNRCRSAPLAL